MGKKEDLAALEHIFIENEAKLRSINAHILSVSRDIDTMSQLEGNLIDNIKYLKKNKVITMADNYKKAKDDLAKTVVRVVSLMNDRENLRKAAKQCEKEMEVAQIRTKELQKDNVLYGDFRRKNG
jgi:hypothetical protein